VYSRSSWRSWRASLWARAAWLCFVFALFLPASPGRLSARTPSESELRLLTESLSIADQRLTELETLLPALRSTSTELGQKLEQAEQRLSELGASLRLWQEHSAELESSLERSSQALEKLRSSQAELTTRYVALLRSWSAYRLEMKEQVAARDLAARRWRTVALAGIPAAALVTAVAMLVWRPHAKP